MLFKRVVNHGARKSRFYATPENHLWRSLLLSVDIPFDIYALHTVFVIFILRAYVACRTGFLPHDFAKNYIICILSYFFERQWTQE